MPALLAGPLAILGLALILVTLPIGLPLAALLDRRRRRRLSAAVAGTRCERCGDVLGEAALAAADAAHRAKLAALQRRHPTSLVNLLRRADAHCTKCGKAYAWEARSAALLAVQDDD